MKSNIEIAQEKILQPIEKIAKKISLAKNNLILYGQHKAKIPCELFGKYKGKKDGRLVLVTAINPTAAGEGKTTTSIGLGQALSVLKKKTIICLREPSLGPCFGVKGGATGAGRSQVLPMEDIDLHFTGDIHAVTSAHNLLAALIDNHIYHGNELKINPEKIFWRRVVDISDRALRSITIRIAKNKTRETGYDISVASEVMAILCLSLSLGELKKRLGQIIIGVTYEGEPITAHHLKAEGAMSLLLKDAINPNLVQTYEGTPAFIHGGPFANIAHGCSSLMATKLALKLSDYVITEAGFGADLGAEKFFDIKCRQGKLKPNGVVIVVSIKALKLHGSGDIKTGLFNLDKHLENIRLFGKTSIVALNRFPDDTDREIKIISDYCRKEKILFSVSEAYGKGGKGATDLAAKVINICENKNNFNYLYQTDVSPEKIIEIIAKKIYGAEKVEFTVEAKMDLKIYKNWGIVNLPVCMAKTQYSLSDNPKLLGRPKDFTVTINRVKIAAGAGFFVALAGKIMTMPGLPKIPAAEKIDIDDSGKVTGLF